MKDSDDDGLLDRWEASAAPIYDPRGQQLPNLNAMGASSTVKDVFIEVGYMHTDENGDGVPDDASYGGVVKQGHAHLPGHDALKLMGDAFANAPSGRVNLHFDVGATYPAGDPVDPAKNADAYLVRRDLARGGEGIRESVTQCAPGANVWECQFSQYPGTVGWKSGFRFLRDEVLNPVPVPAGQDDPCDAAGATCERRFDRNRTHMFHYALFAHALGLPQSEKACVVGGVPTDDVNGVCAPGTDNPKFHTPVTNTGIGDFPGGDLLVTLGGFNDLFGRPIGTPFMQASTLMHEFGHNAERRHGGEALEQNCKPTYLSVMNYMYQLRGLLDDNGTPNLDFSGTVGAEVNETGLGALAYQPYRLGWYAPLDTSYLAGRRLPALRHCNGSDLLPGEAAMVRIDARTAAGVIDWDADGRAGSATALDVNFNGRLDGPAQFPALLGSNDWSNLALNQIGSRRNVGGIYRDLNTGAFIVGPLSLDSGKGDLGKGDLGKGDLGKGDLGKGDLGGGDLFLNDPNNPPGELDAVTAADLAKAAPNTFAACVIGAGCRPPITGALHDVHLSFTAPNEGNLANFVVYRVDGADLVYAPAGQPQQVWTPVATLPAVLGQSSYQTVDSTELVDGASYTYFAVARYLDDPATARVDAVESDPSRLVTIEAKNEPPAALGDTYSTSEDTALSVPAPGVLANDGDRDSPLTLAAQVVTGTGPSHGTLRLNADGSFTYTPAENYHGADSFTYRATSGAIALSATVTITVTPVNDAPVAVGDSATTLEDIPVPVSVLGNDTDIDGDTLTALVASGPTKGTLTPGVAGVFTYTPAPNSNGSDSFTYTVNDGVAASAEATVTITVTPVNDAPVAVGDSATTLEDIPVPVSVLGNDTDIDGDTLTALVASGPTKGTLTPGVAGVFTYTPAPNSNGSDSFTYTVNDGTVNGNTVTVSLLVTAVNDPPVGAADNYSINEDTLLTVAAPGVLGNDTDVDSPPASRTAVLVTGPTRGSLMLNANGSFSYTPALNYNGPDAFTYKANDGTADSNVVTVAITVTSVNDPPTISDIVDRTINWNTNTGALTFAIGDVDGLTGVSVTGASSNTTLVPSANIVFAGSGANRTVTVTPTANQSGTAVITVTVQDAGGLQASDTFLLTVQRDEYTFVGLQNIPSPLGKTYTAGRSIPLGWQYKNGATVVDSSQVRFQVTVVGPLPNPTVNNTDSGQSSFRYSGGAWSFNLQTKNASGTAFPVGTYQVTVKSLTAGYPSSAPFTVTLVK